MIHKKNEKLLLNDINVLLKKRIMKYDLTKQCQHLTDEQIKNLIEPLGGQLIAFPSQVNQSLFKIYLKNENNIKKYIFSL